MSRSCARLIGFLLLMSFFAACSVVPAPTSTLVPSTATRARPTPTLQPTALPKPIGLTINYLRSGRALDSYASASIVKQGRRVVAFEARAWQDDPARPIASAFGHFMLRQAPGVDEE